MGRLNQFYAFGAFLTLLLCGGCKIEIAVLEGGTVTTESGRYECLSPQVCIIDVVDADFDETFNATPTSGYGFAGWRKRDGGFCGGSGQPCRLFTTGFQAYDALMNILKSDTVFYLTPLFARPNTWTQAGSEILGIRGSMSFSANGDRLAIGAPDGARNNSGLVRVFRWSGAAWLQLGQDIEGKSIYDSLGTSVSLSADGSRLAIGAPYHGQARVYDWTGREWVQRGGDIEGDNTHDRFGQSVSLSADGGLLAIGSNRQIYDGPPSYVRVYRYSPETDTWRQRGPDLIGVGKNDDGFGFSVSLSADGNRLAIGASKNDDNGNDAGEVKVYQWSGTEWQKMGGDLNGKREDDRFGVTVALSADGSRLAINTLSYDTTGSVLVYAWSGTAWVPFGQEIPGLKVSLSADGNRVAVISTPCCRIQEDARVYRYSVLAGAWQQLGQKIEVDQNSSDASVVISATANRLAVLGSEYAARDGGRVRIYEMLLEQDTQ